MNSLLNSSRNADTFQFRDIEALLILNGATLLPGLGSTLPPRDGLLNSSLGDLTLALLDISANGIRNIATILLCDRLICGLGNLVANLFRNLSAHWPRSSS